MRSLIFIISAIAVFRDAASDCNFDAVSACGKRNFGKNFVQYVGNPCNPSSFYQCERTRNGVIAHLQPCKTCLEWSDATWSCSIRNGKKCDPTEAPITEVISQVAQYCQRTGNGPAGVYTQQFRPGDDWISYYWVVFGQELLFPCPPGTRFDFPKCQCLTCYEEPCAGSNPRVFTLDFDGKGSENGIYYVVDESGVLSSDSISGVSLELDGESTDIEVPFFQNNDFSEFKFDGYFKRDSEGGDGEQGILFNGASPAVDCWPGSIYVISSSPTSLRAGIVTDGGSFEIDSSAAIAADEWTRVTLSYNGTLLSLTVNGVKDSTSASGVTLRTKCNLYFGKSYDVNGVEHFFRGKLDNLSWYRVAS